MAKKQALVITIRQEGVRETLAAFRGLPKEANVALRDAAGKIAQRFATAATAAGIAEGSQAALVAKTVRAGRDRVPVVTAGGSKRLGGRKAPAWKLLFGSEFGSNRFTQFRRTHQGTDGIWFFPTIEREAPAIIKEWREAADQVLRAFTKSEG
jgi:hypothetical protein